jgi:DNA repair exonuclease SbcCD ATPase subunit
LFEDSTDISATGTKAIIQTQAILEQKLGLTLGEWFGFVYLAQKHTHAMVDGRPAEKKEYLSRVFGLDVIDNHDKNLKVYMSDLSEAKSKSDALLEREVELKKLLRTVPTQSSTSLDLVVDDLRKQLVNAKVELSKSKQSRKRKVVAERLHKLGILQGTESYGPNTSSTLEKLRLSVKSELAEAQKNYELQKQIDKLKSKIPDDPLDEAKLKHKLDGIHKQLSELRAFAKGVSQLRELDNQLTLLKSTQDKAGKYDSDKAAEYEKSLKKLEDKISVLKASVSALEKFQAGGDTCPSCLQTVPESHVKQIKTTLATSKSELVTLTKDHKKIKELIEDLEELQELKGKISNCRNKRQEALDNIPFDVTPDKIPTDAELSKTIESFELKAESLQAKVILASKQAEWKKELDSAPKVKSINLDDIATLEKKLEALTDAKAFSWERSNDNFKSVKKECRELSRRYRKAVKRQLRIKTAASERERIQTEIHELKKQLSSLQKQTDSYNLASTIRLGLKDLKLVRLREATGILTDILPAYVAALFPGKNIKVKVDKRKGDSFDLLVEKGGKIIPLHSLSGGQLKRRSTYCNSW